MGDQHFWGPLLFDGFWVPLSFSVSFSFPLSLSVCCLLSLSLSLSICLHVSLPTSLAVPLQVRDRRTSGLGARPTERVSQNPGLADPRHPVPPLMFLFFFLFFAFVAILQSYGRGPWSFFFPKLDGTSTIKSGCLPESEGGFPESLRQLERERERERERHNRQRETERKRDSET